MTGRGPANSPPCCPPSPRDPTLDVRPVPLRRDFEIRSFGPGAPQQVRTTQPRLADISSAAVGSDKSEFSDYRRLIDDIARSASFTQREDERLPEPDFTWGFYVFVTAYDKRSLELLPAAVESLLKVQEVMMCRHLSADASEDEDVDVYEQETFRRMRFDVVLDQEALVGASDYRVRESFRALNRASELYGEDDFWGVSVRSQVCLVLDAAKIEELANLTHYDTWMEELRAHDKVMIPALDIRWKRPELTMYTYRGVCGVEATMLGRMYVALHGESLEDYASYEGGGLTFMYPDERSTPEGLRRPSAIETERLGLPYTYKKKP